MCFKKCLFTVKYFFSQCFEIATLRTKPIYTSIEKNDYEIAVINEMMDR
jgi:hypothetical protein